MNLINNVNQLLKRYNLQPVQIPNTYQSLHQYVKLNPSERSRFSSKKNDNYFTQKYRDYMTKGKCVFTLGWPVIPVWCEIIDEVISQCIDFDPDLVISDVTINFGRLVFNVHSNYRDIDEVRKMMEDRLYDKFLKF